MATTTELIQLLKCDKIIQSSPKLSKLVKSLEFQDRQARKIASQYSVCISLMSDGMEYDEAYAESLKHR